MRTWMAIHVRGMCAACARYVRGMCAACVRHVCGMCAACARYLRGVCAVCARHVRGRYSGCRMFVGASHLFCARGARLGGSSRTSPPVAKIRIYGGNAPPFFGRGQAPSLRKSGRKLRGASRIYYPTIVSAAVAFASENSSFAFSTMHAKIITVALTVATQPMMLPQNVS